MADKPKKPTLRLIKIGKAGKDVSKKKADDLLKAADAYFEPYELASLSKKEARELIPFEIAKSYNILPMDVRLKGDKRSIILFVDDDVAADNLSAIRFMCGCDIETVVIESVTTLRKAIFIAYKGKELAFPVEREGDKDSHTSEELISRRSILKDRSTASIYLKAILDYAIANKASDVHILPERESLLVSMRIDGIMYSPARLVKNGKTKKAIYRLIKVLCGISEKHGDFAPEGSFEYVTEAGDRATVRVNIIPSVFGEKISCRMIYDSKIQQLNELGFEGMALSMINKGAFRRQGLVVFSGPTGSGKSTAMKSIAQELALEGRNVITIEDPVETILKGVTHIDLSASKLGYADALRATLRQDPDVIVVGEIRDHESAVLVKRASLSGHLVLASVHARSSIKALSALEGMGISANSLAESVNLVVYQRLLPRICKYCRTKVGFKMPHTSEGAAAYVKEYHMYRAAGCQLCGFKGSSGRYLVAEVLLVDRYVENMIREGLYKNEVWMQGQLKQEHYIPLGRSIEDALMRGIISIDSLRDLV